MWLLTVRDLLYRRTRFLVVTVATALVFTLLFLMTGLVEQFNQEPFLMVDAIGGEYWVVPAGTSGPFTSSSTVSPEVAESVQAREGGEQIVIARGTMTIAGEPTEALVVGHELGGIVSPPILEGREAEGPLEVVLDESTGIPVGSAILLGETPLTVVGVTADATVLAGLPGVFLEIDEARSAVFDGAPVVSSLVFDSEPASVPGELKVLTGDEVASDALGPLENAVSSVDLIRVLLWVVAAIIIGAVVYLSSLERSRDFAVLKAVGGRDRQLAGSLALQALAVALLAVVLAAILQALIVPVFPLKVRVPGSALWQLPAVAVVVAMVAALAGMRRVRRTDPAQAFGGAQ